uniref:Solute carrier family 5 member 8, like n=1 Tax=Scleropages formosus TaxID=113540 RepID=A0A8C9W9J9_SCLFO
MAIMLAGFVAVITRGAVLQGGLTKIWEDARQGQRLEAFDFDPDPLRRHTFWTIVVGGSLMWTSIYAINQSQVQRYISCRTMTHAKLSLYVNMVGLWVTVTLAVLSGLTMYSIYKDCDPLSNKDVGASDQLLPYLVMDILSEFPGVPGLFVAAAYSGTLSTVSSSINALVAVTMEDFVKPVWTTITEQQVHWSNMALSESRLWLTSSDCLPLHTSYLKGQIHPRGPVHIWNDQRTFVGPLLIGDVLSLCKLYCEYFNLTNVSSWQLLRKLQYMIVYL